MKLIEYIDHQDYHHCTKELKRRSVKAIVIKENKIAMIQSAKYGELKFPGGGQQPNETDIDTLKRELLEETGLTLRNENIIPFGMTHEIRNSVFEENTKFEMISVYYFCETDESLAEIKLDPYEEEYGYHLVFVDIDDAIIKNNDLVLNHKEIITKYVPWTERELAVLRDLKRFLLSR